MAAPLRPRRSVLYMPASNPRALDKARGLPADGLIFDLEDAVAPEAKAAARDAVAAAVRAGGYARRELVLRVNALDTPWGVPDLVAAAALPLDAVLLPKVESAAQVHAAFARLDAAGASAALSLWCMIETPKGVLGSAEIAAASPRAGALVMGTSDLVADLHARATRDRLPLVAALGLVVLAARACGLAALDGVHLDLSDEDGFVAACRQGREFGFDGKTLIHPSQIAAANAAFSPDPAEIERARHIVAAYAEAEAAGKGVVVLDGRLVEALHAAEARRTLALAETIAAVARTGRPA